MQHIVIRVEEYVAGSSDKPEVQVFTQSHASRPGCGRASRDDCKNDQIAISLQSGFEPEYTARAASDALAAGDAAAVADYLTAPNVASDIDANRADVRADAALDATQRIGHNTGAGKCLASTVFLIQQT